MQGVIISTTQMPSNFGGDCYKNIVVCTDGATRVLWVDPKMDNWRHWAKIMKIAMHPKYQDHGIVLEDLKILKKKGRAIPNKLDADYPPTLVGVVEDIGDL